MGLIQFGVCSAHFEVLCICFYLRKHCKIEYPKAKNFIFWVLVKISIVAYDILEEVREVIECNLEEHDDDIISIISSPLALIIVFFWFLEVWQYDT
ncbi:hypothetical protein F8388_017220 [Cannabis sativa]|uniref:Uncharacterized protein n=1 Tax=Cannabis sativa TaxID=3483 RepID=A0A7J6FWE9_CANSA|nr:hypothetical protein F8388_017220 [Cannabis sativa]KAF4401981.1 hypothetical protein G4B88_017493 [Cannabis sativa]